MARNPTKVELFENGDLKLTLTKSDEGSLNGKDSYTGRATTARIHGPKGSAATFYDDQKFRKGENSVWIEKRIDEPVTVPLASNFVGRDDAEGEKAYLGQTPKYNFVFFRKRKLEWWEKAIAEVPGGKFVFDAVKNFVEDSDDPRVKEGAKIVKAPFKPPDENYSLDNCSSVRFGDLV